MTELCRDRPGFFLNDESVPVYMSWFVDSLAAHL